MEEEDGYIEIDPRANGAYPNKVHAYSAGGRGSVKYLQRDGHPLPRGSRGNQIEPVAVPESNISRSISDQTKIRKADAKRPTPSVLRSEGEGGTVYLSAGGNHEFDDSARKSFESLSPKYLNRGASLISKGMDEEAMKRRSSLIVKLQEETMSSEDFALVDTPRDKGNVKHIALASSSVIDSTRRERPRSVMYMQRTGSVAQYPKTDDWGRKMLPNVPIMMLQRTREESQRRSTTPGLRPRSLPKTPSPLMSAAERMEHSSSTLPNTTLDIIESESEAGMSDITSDNSDADMDPVINKYKSISSFGISPIHPAAETHPETASNHVGAGSPSVVDSLMPASSPSQTSSELLGNRRSLQDLLDSSGVDFDPLMMQPFPDAPPNKCVEAVIKATEYFGQKNFGTVEFDNFNTAWFIRIKKSRDGPDMASKIIAFLAEQLKYPLPRLLISVTGGAKDFELTTELEQVLKRGLRKAAEATNAWVVSGGSDCGIMKYVGQAMADIDSGMASQENVPDGSDAIRIPVIGVASFGVLAAHNVLSKGGVNLNFAKFNNDPSAPPAQDVGLDKNHKVFLLYDDGSKGTFGTETRTRSRFEETLVRRTSETAKQSKNAMFRSTKIFPVCLVVEGGPGTLNTVEAAIESNTPVVVIEGSGRMAEVIAYAWRYLNDSSPESRYLTLSGLRSKIRRVIPMTNEQVMKKQIDVLRLVLQATQITIYSLEDDIREDQDIDGVDHALLKAILRSLKIKPVDTSNPNRRNTLLLKGLDRHSVGLYNMYQTKLFLSMMFNQAETANDHLMLLRSITRDAKAADPKRVLNTDLEDCLIWALTKQRSEFSKMLCRIVDIASMLQNKDKQSLDIIFNASNNAWSRNYLEVLYEAASKRVRYKIRNACCGKPKHQTLYQAMLNDKKKGGTAKTMTLRLNTSASEYQGRNSLLGSASPSLGSSSAFSDLRLVDVVNQLIGTVAIGTHAPTDERFHVIGRSIKDDRGRVSNAPETKLNKDRAYQDLLIWAVITSRLDLATFFWSEGGNSISTSLFASVLSERLARNRVLARHGHFRDVLERMKRISNRFEDLAIGVLDTCYKENSLMAQTILRLELGHLHLAHHSPDFRDCVSMAFAGKKLNFISHPACLALIEREWMGEIDPTTNKIWVALTAIFPFLLWQSSIFHIQFRGEAITSLFGDLGGRVDPSGEEFDIDDLDSDENRQKRTAREMYKKGTRRFFHFYRAPYVKFCLDIVSYITLVVLYLYVLLNFSGGSLTSDEIVLLCWMSVVSVEELGQCAAAGVRRWWREHWNKLDFALYLSYWLGAAFRFVAQNVEQPYKHPWSGWAISPFFYIRVAKLFMAIGSMCLLGRILRFYLYSRVLGPKIVMVMRMSVDIGAFLAMLLVAILMYGAATEAMRPALTGNGEGPSNWRMFYRPYFQIFGELFIDNVHEETECLGVEPFENCGSSLQIIIMYFTAIYLFVTNVVLINLLIATMARRFEEVQAQAVKVWRYEQYDLLIEYKNKSKLPNPFSFISSVYEISKGLKSCNKTAKEKDSEPMSLEKEMFFRQLESFQEKNTERFLESVSQSTINSDSARIARLEMQAGVLRTGVRELHTQTQRLDNRIYRTHEAISSVSKWLSDTLVPLVKQGGSKLSFKFNRDIEGKSRSASPAVEVHRRMSEVSDLDSADHTDMEDVSHQTVDEIQTSRIVIIRHLSKHMFKSIVYPSSPDRLFGFFRPDPGTYNRFTIDNRNIIFASRTLDDPTATNDHKIICMFEKEAALFQNKTFSEADLRHPRKEDKEVIVRQQIPSKYLDWSVEWPGYDPPDFTSPYVYCFGPSSPCPGFKWAHDSDPRKCKIAESAHSARWEANGRPVNPLGRVGIRGRGLLGKWGPNLAIDQVVTRWKRNENQIQVERRGKPILEVVLCKRTDTGEWALPGGFQGMADGVNPLIRKVFGLEPDQVQDNEDLQEVEAILKNSKLFYKGLTCDPRDTDNAWVESAVMHVHDDTNILSKYEMTEGSNPAIKFVSWATIHKDMVMFANHATILEKIAEQMNALW